jgi:exodeoxyribonuclease-3
VNSPKARLSRVQEWISESQPDVLLIQETKLAQDKFPHAEMTELGYESAHFGQGQWNGVAIISRVGLDNVVNNFATGIEPDGEARIITANCGGVQVSSVYVPNGRSLDHDHYQYKLSWLSRLRAHLDASCKPTDDVVVGGDFNIAPADADVHDPKAWEGQNLVSPAERSAFQELLGLGLYDSFRMFEQAPKIYSWWDYRMMGFRRNAGMRIDHILLSDALKEKCNSSVIDKEPRTWEQPSDHAPVIAEIKKA